MLRPAKISRPIRLTPKEVQRADQGITLAIRPQKDGTYMVGAFQTDGRPVGAAVYLTDDIPAAIREVNRWLGKLGYVGQKWDASRDRRKDAFSDTMSRLADEVITASGWNAVDHPDVKQVFNGIRDALLARGLRFVNEYVGHSPEKGKLYVDYRFRSPTNGTIELRWTLSRELSIKAREGMEAYNNQLGVRYVQGSGEAD